LFCSLSHLNERYNKELEQTERGSLNPFSCFPFLVFMSCLCFCCFFRSWRLLCSSLCPHTG
jgi:hypothetical protein